MIWYKRWVAEERKKRRGMGVEEKWCTQKYCLEYLGIKSQTIIFGNEKPSNSLRETNELFCKSFKVKCDF